MHGQEHLVRAPPFSSSGSFMRLPQCRNKRIDIQRERLFGLVRSFLNNEYNLLRADNIDWDAVREMIAQNLPSCVYIRSDWHGVITRHFIHHLLLIGASNDVLVSVIEACPDCVTWCDLNQSNSRWVALHYACANARQEENIKTVLDAYPEASKALSKGCRGRLPLHIYLHYAQYPSDYVLHELLQAYPQSTSENVLDSKGCTIVRLLCHKWGRYLHDSRTRSEPSLIHQCINQIHLILRTRYELSQPGFSTDEKHSEEYVMQAPSEFLPLHLVVKDGGLIDLWSHPSEPHIETMRDERNIISHFIEENSSHVAVADAEGNTPLHLVADCKFKRNYPADCQFSRDYPVEVDVVRRMHFCAIKTLLMLDDTIASVPDAKGRFPLHIGANSKMCWYFGLQLIWQNSPLLLKLRDPTNLLYPFMAAAVGTDADLGTIFEMLKVAPELVLSTSV